MNKTYIIKNEKEFEILKAILPIIDIENKYPQIFVHEPGTYSLSDDGKLTGDKALFKNLHKKLTAINVSQDECFFKGRYFFQVPMPELHSICERIKPVVELKGNIQDMLISFYENKNEAIKNS